MHNEGSVRLLTANKQFVKTTIESYLPQPVFVVNRKDSHIKTTVYVKK